MKNKHPTQSEQFQNLMKNKTSHTVRTVPKFNEKQNIPVRTISKSNEKQNIPQSEQFQNLWKNKTSHSQNSSKI
jgi:3-methyladenine DNA glycosylase AlkC